MECLGQSGSQFLCNQTDNSQPGVVHRKTAGLKQDALAQIYSCIPCYHCCFHECALLRDYATSIAQSHILAKSETKPLAVQNERTKNGSLDMYQLFYN